MRLACRGTGESVRGGDSEGGKSAARIRRVAESRAMEYRYAIHFTFIIIFLKAMACFIEEDRQCSRLYRAEAVFHLPIQLVAPLAHFAFPQPF